MNTTLVGRVLSVLLVAYLLSGLPNVLTSLGEDGFARNVAIVYLACILLGLAAGGASFTRFRRTFRLLALWAIGIPALIYTSPELAVTFPTYIHVPLTFTSRYSSGEVYGCGIDLIAGALFIALWFATKAK